MKKLIFTLTLMISLFARAQQADLTNNTWYLYKVIVDDVEYLQPINAEFTQTITATFNNAEIYTSACNWIRSGYFTNLTDEVMEVNQFIASLIECNLAENTNFENTYFGIFFNNINIDEIYSPFSYTIVTVDDHQVLTVTNTQGNKAIYGNVNLSVDEVKLNNQKVAIYPNPVKEKIHLEMKKVSNDYSVIITNLIGEQLLKQKLSTDKLELDVSFLEKGIYLCSIYDENQKMIHSEKIIKE